MLLTKVKMRLLRKKAMILRSITDFFDNQFSLTTYRLGSITKEVYSKKDVRFSRLFELLKPNELEVVNLSDEEKSEAKGLLESLENDPVIRFNKGSHKVAESLGRMFAMANLGFGSGKSFGDILRGLQDDNDSDTKTKHSTGQYL